MPKSIKKKLSTKIKKLEKIIDGKIEFDNVETIPKDSHFTVTFEVHPNGKLKYIDVKILKPKNNL